MTPELPVATHDPDSTSRKTTAGAADYYARRWAGDGKLNAWAMRRAAVILAELAELDLVEPRMLDLGCGSGWLTAMLSEFGDAEGVDLAPEPARRRYPHLRFHAVSESPAGPFDVVVSQEVIEHADDQRAYLSQAHALLRPGGFLILTTPNAAVSLGHPELLIQPLEQHLTRKQLRSALLDAGFEPRKLYSFFFGFSRKRPYRLRKRFGRQLNGGLHLLAVCTRAH